MSNDILAVYLKFFWIDGDAASVCPPSLGGNASMPPPNTRTWPYLSPPNYIIINHINNSVIGLQSYGRWGKWPKKNLVNGDDCFSWWSCRNCHKNDCDWVWIMQKGMAACLILDFYDVIDAALDDALRAFFSIS